MKCRECGAHIIFLKTAKGKQMPCEDHITYYKDNKDGKNTIMSVKGEIKKCDYVSEEERLDARIGYIPHWVNCPGAEKFRRRA